MTRLELCAEIAQLQAELAEARETARVSGELAMKMAGALNQARNERDRWREIAEGLEGQERDRMQAELTAQS